MDEAGLLKLKKQIDDAKRNTSELKGHLSALMKQLKDEWKCNTIEDAEKLSKRIERDLKDLNTKIETGLNELEEKYGN